MNILGLWIALCGLVRKEVARFMRGYFQTFLPSLLTTILYFLVFGEVMGHKIGEMMGLPYTVFITPGLVMLAVINNSYTNVVSSFFGARFVRSIEELLVSPMPNWLIIIGFVSGGVVRGLLVGILVLVISLYFAHFAIAHISLVLLLIVLCSILFSLLGLFNGVFARKFDDLVIVPTFILTPLIYLGGVFFNISELPHNWQPIAQVNPVHYLIESFRYALLGIHDGHTSLITAMIGIVAFIVVFFIVDLVLMNKGVRLKS